MTIRSLKIRAHSLILANRKVSVVIITYCRLSHDVVTYDVNRDVWTAYC